ncbi:MAG: apolipoprotein acyltransferase [Paracoccaceae bacterium]
MIVIAGLFIGTFWGWRAATRREGNRFDRIQFALVYAILCGLIGLLITIVLARMA